MDFVSVKNRRATEARLVGLAVESLTRLAEEAPEKAQLVSLRIRLNEPAARGQGGAVDCPGCRESMRQQTLDWGVVDRCDGCGGLWLDAGELRSWRDTAIDDAEQRRRALGAFEPIDGVATSACPSCHAVDGLRAGRVATIEVRHCAMCRGLFLTRDACEDVRRRFDARAARATSVSYGWWDAVFHAVEAILHGAG